MINKQSHTFSSNYGYNCTRSIKNHIIIMIGFASYDFDYCYIVQLFPNWTRMRVITYTYYLNSNSIRLTHTHTKIRNPMTLYYIYMHLTDFPYNMIYTILLYYYVSVFSGILVLL